VSDRTLTNRERKLIADALRDRAVAARMASTEMMDAPPGMKLAGKEREHADQLARDAFDAERLATTIEMRAVTLGELTAVLA